MIPLSESVKLLNTERDWLAQQLELYRKAVDWLAANEGKLRDALCHGEITAVSVLGSITTLAAANHSAALRLTTLWPGKWQRVAYDGTITYVKNDANMTMHIRTKDAGPNCRWEERMVAVPATAKLQKVLVCNENEAV